MRTYLSHKSTLFGLGILGLLIAMTGSATAASMITGFQIKNNTVSTKDIKNNNVKSFDIRDKSVKPKDLAPAARGFTGYQVVFAETGAINQNEGGSVRAICPTGKKAIGGGAAFVGGAVGDSTIGRSNPELFVNGVVAQPTSTNANSWFAFGRNETAQNRRLRVYVICAVASS